MARQAADTFNNAAGLADITADDQGMSTAGLQYPRYINCADGSVKPDGAPFEVLEYTNQTAAEYTAILTAFGLTTAIGNASNEITYRTPGADRSTYANYNAIVVHRKGVDATFEDGRYTRVTFTIKIVEAL